jgi:hypothetical protein
MFALGPVRAYVASGVSTKYEKTRGYYAAGYQKSTSQFERISMELTMRERCIKVALENTPSNVRCVRIRKDLSGLAETSGPDAGLLCAPRPITRRALYVYLHECAHFVLHTGEKNGERPRYVEEYEAEQWAHKVMRAAGIPVPRAETRQAKENIAYLLRRVKRKKGRRIDPRIRAFGK